MMASMHSVTLMPRLGHCTSLLAEISAQMHQRRLSLAASNKDGHTEHSMLLERTYLYCHEALHLLQGRFHTISNVNSIPGELASAISVIRTTSARLHVISPDSSKRLLELSACLGSVVLDSAALSGARFDFGRSNKESSALLNKVKLITDSKLKEQYPNLDLSEPDGA